MRTVLFCLIFCYSAAFAEGTDSAPNEPPVSAQATSTQATATPIGTEEEPSAPKPSRGKTRHEKDADGTEAPRKFDGDISEKSRYEYKGQSLEIDKD